MSTKPAKRKEMYAFTRPDIFGEKWIEKIIYRKHIDNDGV